MKDMSNKLNYSNEKNRIHHFRQVRQLGTGLSFCCP